jgi:predicted Zn-dependent peptidase
MTLDEILAKYESLTPEDLSKVAQKLLKDNLWTYWIE